MLILGHVIVSQMTEFMKSMSKDPVVPKGKILRRTQTAMW
jgi:hypothetical protein